jgi:hypothetical protein
MKEFLTQNKKREKKARETKKIEVQNVVNVESIKNKIQ